MSRENILRANERLRDERLRRGWSQQKLADELGIAVVTVNRWERGKQQPTGYYRLKLSTLFDKSAEELGLVEEIHGSEATAYNEEQDESTSEIIPLSLAEQEGQAQDSSLLHETVQQKQSEEKRPPLPPYLPNRRSDGPLSNKKRLRLLLLALITLVIAAPITFFLMHSTKVSQTTRPSLHAPFTPPSKWSLIVDDPMTKTNHDINWDVDPNCSFHSDGYYFNSQGTNYCNYGDSSVHNFSDIAYSIDMIFYKGTMGGLVFRLDNDYYYGFYITTKGEYRILWHTADNGGDDHTLIDKTSSMIHQGVKKTNTLSVFAQGSSFTFWINGQQVDTRTNTKYKSGTIGVFGGDPDDNSNPTTEALFKNAKVWVP